MVEKGGTLVVFKHTLRDSSSRGKADAVFEKCKTQSNITSFNV